MSPQMRQIDHVEVGQAERSSAMFGYDQEAS